jgi:nucleoid-associated protein YgaU
MKAREGRIMGRKAIASIAALLAVILLGVAGVYLYRQTPLVSLGEGTKRVGESEAAPAPIPAAPEASAPRSQPTPPTEAASAPPQAPMVVPSFDVVLVEPSGEGVFAGRAGPGWIVEIESGGTKIAETTADGQGEWSVVLDKKLAPGDHTLSLRTIAPDGTRALTSQQNVSVAVGNANEQAASAPRSTENVSEPPAQTEASPVETAPQRSASSEAPDARPQIAAVPVQQLVPPAQSPSAGRASQENPAKAAVTFKIVDYRDIGADSGKMKVSGTSDPGATIQLSFDGKPFATAKADTSGVWKTETDMKLGEGGHSLKAMAAGMSAEAGQAAIVIERRPVVAEEPVAPSPQVAAAEGTSPTATEEQTGGRPDVYEIRRGDTLWDIAKRYLGSGMAYTSIFHGNREIIRNPNLILPAQKVKMPPP